MASRRRMSRNCSKCREINDRPEQRYCSKCHAAYQKGYRAQQRDQLAELVDRLMTHVKRRSPSLISQS